MHIVETVYYWARSTPSRPAVIEPAGTLTYADLANAIEMAAEHFAGNVDRTKPVAVAFSSGPKMLVSVLGLLRLGIDVVLATKELYKHLPSVGVDTLICERDAPRMATGNHVIFDDGWLVYGKRTDAQNKPLPLSKPPAANILCFTSGSTGRPKIVVCPQSSWEQRVLLPLNSAYQNYNRILVVPGLSTSWGLSRAYEALHSGRTICLAPPGPPMLWMAQTYDVETILASPQQALQLAEIQENVTHYPLAALKEIQIGASAITAEGVSKVKRNLCRNITLIYGSTEAGVVALAPYDTIASTPGAVGFVMPGVTVEIVDSMQRVLPVGSEGFIRVRSSVLTENLAAARSTDDWFYPGDLGRLTDTGMLCVAGRVSDVVNRGGEKFSITDFERFLMSCPGVKDAGVCTVMGDVGYEEAWISVVLEPNADMALLRQSIESNSQFGANIDKIFAVEAIPRGTLGKIQREELRAMLKSIVETAAANSRG